MCISTGELDIEDYGIVVPDAWDGFSERESVGSWDGSIITTDEKMVEVEVDVSVVSFDN